MLRDAATILRAIAVIVIVGVVCSASSVFSVVMFLHLEEGNETNEEGGSDTRNRERDDVDGAA